MVAKLVSIGNSRGLRIPKAMIEQAGLEEEVELEVRGKRLIIQSAKRPREGWGAAFAAMRKRGHDKLLDTSSVSRATPWETAEWKW